MGFYSLNISRVCVYNGPNMFMTGYVIGSLVSETNKASPLA